jgi:hypothetical protein
MLSFQQRIEKGNLRKKNMVVINRCGMCKKDEETVDHLLLHCECAQLLWNAFFNHNVPQDIPMHCSAEEHDQDVDNDDSDVPIDTQEFVRRVVDSSKVQTIGTYVD